MKNFSAFVLVAVLATTSTLLAQTNPRPPQVPAGQITLGGPIQNGDCFVGQRGGATKCISWPPSQAAMPLATSALYGAIKPDNVTTTIIGGVLSAVTSGATPTGPAGGDLGNAYPNPSVLDLSHATMGPAPGIVTSLGVVTTGTWHGGIVGTQYGGTGINAPTIHNLLIGNGSSAMTALAPSTTSGWVLTSNGASSNPSYQAIASSGLPSTTTANLMLQSTTTPGTFAVGSTTWPATVAVNRLLYGIGANQVDALAPCASGVFATNASNTPLCNTNISISSTGKVTMAQSLDVTSTGKIAGGLFGTTTADNGCAGCIGEFISSSIAQGSEVPLASGSAANVTSVTLTPGDWDVRGNVVFDQAPTTITTVLFAALNTTASTLPTPPNGGGYTFNNPATAGGNTSALTITPTRYALPSTTTVYLIGNALFSTSTGSAYGFIGARRMR